MTTATGAGLLSITGAGTAFSYPAGVGVGTLSILGAGDASAYPAAVGVGLLSIDGAGDVTVHPAATGAGLLEIDGSGSGRAAIYATGAGLLYITGAGTAGPLVTGTGAGLLSIVGSGGDYPVATGAGTLSISGAGSAYAGTAAAGRWLYLHTTPPAQVYAVDELRGRLLPTIPMHRAQFSVSATAAQMGQQNDSFGVTLSGAGAALRSRLASQAPYGVRVDVMDGGTVSRSGIVSSVGNTGSAINLDCESQGWSTALPMRTNADLGIFRTVEPLPWRYGRGVRGRCIRLGATGKLWLWADHASERITSVQIDGQDYGAWQWRNDVDAGGSPITVIATADPIDDGAQMIAVGDGKRDSLNGLLIVNPADMVYDLCRVAGQTVTRGELVSFRAECLARDIEISGTIDGGSLQSAMVAISESIYAVFARELPGLMRLLPRSGTAVTIPAKDTPNGTAQRSAISTRLRVRYAITDGDPGASIEVQAPSVERLRGVSTTDVELPLVRDARTAADVAARMLGDMARPGYAIPCAKQRGRIVPGDLVAVSVPAIGITGDALVTASEIDENKSTPTALLRVGTVPAIAIASTAQAYELEQYAGATVSTVGGERELVLTDTNRRPIANARCTLDGSLVRMSDAAGRVSFPLAAMPAGTHTILVEATGMTPLTLTVVV